MAYCATKSKWNSQQIQKRCKNKHDNGLYASWRKYSKSNHSCSWTKFCNEYKKAIYVNRNDHNEDTFDNELNLYQTQYWRCNICTFDNIERDLYCSICESPFQTVKYTSKQSTTTLYDYLPSQCTDTIYQKDDFDESMQIAIILSCNETNPMQTDSEDSDDDIYFDNPHTYNTSTEPVFSGCYKYKSIKTKNRKQYNMKTDEDQSEIQIKSKKQWCLHKSFSAKQKKKQRERCSKENRQLRNNHKKCIKSCPKLSAFINKSKINCIKEDIADSYSDNKQFNIKCILNHNVLRKFGCGTKKALKMVYHGTNYKNNQSIMHNGLICGGTKGVVIRNGSAYGKGVYCSPNTSTARGYENGSMFVCVVKGDKVKRFGSIWVVPDDSILPLFLASFDEKSRVSVPQNTINVNKGNDGLNQRIIKFIPSFASLNVRNRKIKRKWNSYFKLNQFVE